VVFVVRDVLIAAAFVEILWRVFCVDFYFLFRDELTQKLKGILAVNRAVALARLTNVTFLVWSQFRTHLTWCAGLATIWFGRLLTARTSEAIRRSFCNLSALGIFKNALALS